MKLEMGSLRSRASQHSSEEATWRHSLQTPAARHRSAHFRDKGEAGSEGQLGRQQYIQFVFFFFSHLEVLEAQREEVGVEFVIDVARVAGTEHVQ